MTKLAQPKPVPQSNVVPFPDPRQKALTRGLRMALETVEADFARIESPQPDTWLISDATGDPLMRFTYLIGQEVN